MQVEIVVVWINGEECEVETPTTRLSAEVRRHQWFKRGSGATSVCLCVPVGSQLLLFFPSNFSPLSLERW